MIRDRNAALALIKRNIETSGFHIYSVGGRGPTPRFVYTIGLRESLGAELVLAGALYYVLDDVLAIVHSLREQLAKKPNWRSKLSVPKLGSFTFKKAHASWSLALLLCAYDYYRVDEIVAYQIVPEKKRRTIDVPDMSRKWSAIEEPAWRWLKRPWRYSVPESAEAMVDLDALLGAKVTEACRWEDEYWELTAKPAPDVAEEDARREMEPVAVTNSDLATSLLRL